MSKYEKIELVVLDVYFESLKGNFQILILMLSIETLVTKNIIKKNPINRVRMNIYKCLKLTKNINQTNAEIVTHENLTAILMII